MIMICAAGDDSDAAADGYTFSVASTFGSSEAAVAALG